MWLNMSRNKKHVQNHQKPAGLWVTLQNQASDYPILQPDVAAPLANERWTWHLSSLTAI